MLSITIFAAVCDSKGWFKSYSVESVENPDPVHDFQYETLTHRSRHPRIKLMMVSSTEGPSVEDIKPKFHLHLCILVSSRLPGHLCMQARGMIWLSLSSLFHSHPEHTNHNWEGGNKGFHTPTVNGSNGMSRYVGSALPMCHRPPSDFTPLHSWNA